MRTTLTFIQILVTLVFALSFAAEAQIPTNGLRLHLKADAGTSTSTPGGKISQWNDQSGNGFHATETRNVNWQPTYVTDSGFPAVRFSPAGPTSMLLPDHATLGLVNSENEVFLVARTSSAAVQFPFAGGINYTELHFNGASGMRYLPTLNVAVDNPADVDNGAFHVINASATTTNAQLGVDGVFVSQNVNATHAINTGFNLGTRGDGNFRFDGDIAEIIVYNRKLTTAESMQVAEYLKNKYSTPFTAYGAPQTPASGLNFTGVTQTSMNVNLTKGSGTHRVVVARKGGAVTVGPSNGVTYTGNATFGAGFNLGDGNFVVYAGTEGTSTVLSGLEFNESYHVAVYEYYLVGGFPTYGTASVLSQTTSDLSQASSLQILTRSADTFTGSLSAGSGTSRIIVARAGGAVNQGPTNGVTYVGNATFGAGTQIGSGNFVIYAGNDGSSFSLNGLSGTTAYHFAAFEYEVYNGVPKYTAVSPPVNSGITYPSLSASAVQFSSVGLDQMAVSFTSGNGQNRIVIAREGQAVSAVPSDGSTYIANATLGNGQHLGDGNYVVYNGSGNSFTPTGLTHSTVYHFSVYEYNEYNGTINFKTSTPAIGSQSTTVVPLPTVSVGEFSNYASTSVTIGGNVNPNGFETTVSAVYGTDPNNLSSSTTPVSIGSGSVVAPVSIDITGLTTGELYYVAIKATNLRGETVSSTKKVIPLNRTAMRGWFRADMLNSTGLISNAGLVDASGLNQTSSSATGLAEYVQNEINGKPVMRFPSGGAHYEFFNSALGIIETDLEIFVVFKSANNQIMNLISNKGSSTRAPRLTLNEHDAGINAELRIDPFTHGSLNAFTNDIAHIAHFKSTNGKSFIRVDDASPSVANVPNRISADDISIGSANSKKFVGDIAEVIFYNQALSLEQRTELANYLSSRYNIALYTPTTPTSASSNFQFTAVQTNSFSVSMDAGNGEERLIIARLSSSPRTAPANGVSYTANANFGSGSDLGNGNFVVGKGTSTSVNLTGLLANSEYTVDVYEYNFMELEPFYMPTSPNSTAQPTQTVLVPTVQLSPSTNIETNTATIHTIVNPQGFQTTVQVFYGTDSESLNLSVPAQAVGSQATDQEMSTVLTGLTAGTKYYFKALATNSGGSSESGVGVLYTGANIYREGVSLPSLRYWLAGDGALYDLVSGNPMSVWGNQAGNNFEINATQATATNRPQLLTDSGISFVRFDGTDDFMNLPRPDSLAINNSDYEIFIVARTSEASVGFLLAGAAEEYELHTHLGGSNGTRFIPKNGTFIDNNFNSTNGAFHLFNATATSTKGRLRVDGNTVVSNGINAQSSSTESLLLGQRSGNSYHFDGDIAEVLIYNSELSDAENLSVSEYLAQKYSITLTSFTAPTEQATAVSFDVFTADQVTVSATSGNGSNRLFVMRESSVAAVPPTDGTIYTANTVFGSGSTTGAGNFVVSASSDNNVTVTGLTNNITYIVDVYEFNVSGNDVRYLGSPASGYVTFYNSAIYADRIAYVVNSTLDTNTGSDRKGTLRYVLNQINTRAADSTSFVDLRHLRGQITLTADLPPLNFNSIVVGAGQDSLSISGNNLHRPFFIGAGTAPFTAESPAAPNIKMESFSIVNGRGKGGDGYGASGGGAGMGGAIFVNDGSIIIENMAFSSNRAEGGSGLNASTVGFGGGFGGDASSSAPGSSGYLGGTVPTIPGGHGGPGAGGFGSTSIAGNGGFAAGGARSADSEFGTTRLQGGNGGFGGGGGAYGELIVILATTAGSVASGVSEFGGGIGDAPNDNDRYGGGGAGMGGAIFNRSGNLIITNVTFTQNTTQGGAGGWNNRQPGGTYGGAIFNFNGQMLVNNATYSANVATNQSNFYDYNPVNSGLKVATLNSSSNVTSTSATINGTVLTLGYSGSYSVAYGTDPANLSATTTTVNYSNQNSVESFSVGLTGLDLSSMLYYKLVVTNELGTYETKVGSVINDTSIPSDSLKLWVSADRGLELNTSNVANWFDASGKSNTITQSNASIQPAFVSNVINGRPVVRFNGSDTFLEAPTTADLGIQNSDYELFIVMQSSSNDIQFLYSGGAEDYELQLNGSSGFRSIPEAGKFIDGGAAGQLTNGQAQIITSQITNISGSVRVNNELLAQIASDTRNSLSAKLRIGSRSDGSLDFNGDIAEIIIYNKALSVSDRATVMNYLSTKYGITLETVSEPTVAASNSVLIEKQPTSLQFSFTKGNGARRLVVAKANSAVDAAPSDLTVYTANASFGSGTQLGTGNFVVYNGTDTTFTLTGLSAATNYHLAVFEYNGLYESDYLSSSNLTFSAKTLNQIPGTTASSSLKFNGSDEVVTIPHDAAFHTDAITMEMWFKPQNVGAVPFLIAKANEEMEIHLSNSTQSIRFIPTLGVYLDSPNSAFEFNQWNHIAVSYKPSESLAKMWINGIEVTLTNNGTNPLSQPLQHSSLAVLLGQRNGINLPFTGEIDEVRIWNDVRTNQEIREHMFSSIPSDFANLVTYHQFNEGTGSTTLDASSGLNGTLANFEFDANNGWINSGIPFGTGTVSASVAVSSGTINASGLDITLTENFDNAVSVVAKQFTVAPLVETSGNTINLNNPYWVVETSPNAGAFEASLTFTVPSGFLNIGSLSANQIKLYSRSFGSDGAWSVLKSAAVSVTSSTVTFDGVSEFGQFALARDFTYDFNANAGNSILFDGINDYVQIPFNAAMNTQKLTLEFWLKWNRSGAAVDFVVSRGGEEWEVHLGAGSNGIRFIPRGSVFIDSQVEAFTPGQWNHLAFVYDPSQSLGKIYVNGADVTGAVSGNLASPLVNTNFGINLGRRQSNESLHFSGELDEFRVWNSARTQQQIQENMNRTLPDGYYSDLVMYFQFNEGTGTSTSEIQSGLTGTHINFDYNQSSGWVSSLTPITQELGISTTLTGTAGWRLLSNPVTNTSFAAVLNPLWTQGATGADNEGGGVNVFTWATTSSDNNAASWTPISSYNDEFTPGKGILMYVYSDDNGPNVEGNSGFPKSLQINGVTNGQDVNLGAQLNPNVDGWSLLGNPFAANIDWDLVTKSGLNNSVYVWDHNGSAWKYWNTGVGTLPNGIVGTMNAFFVETAQLNPTLTIPSSAQVSGQVAFLGKESAHNKATFISLDLQVGNESNTVIIHLNENARLERDALDALWLQSLNPSDIAFAALTEAGEQLSIFSAPSQASILEIPLYVNVSGDRNGRLNMDSLAHESGYFARIWDSQTGTFYLPGETVSIEPTNENSHSSLDNLMESETSNGDEEKGLRSVSDRLPRMNTQSNIGQRYILQLSKEPFEVAFPELPSEITLQQNFPNPFNPSTTFRFGLPQKAEVSITVMDILGRVVAQPVRGSKTAGWHTYSWDASQLSSGVYFYYLQVNGKLSKTMKMTLVK